MSVIKFELTEDHIKLVRQLQINQKEVKENLFSPEISGDNPFGDDIFMDMFLILYGKPEGEIENPNPWDENSSTPWNDEQLEYMIKLLNELSYALDVILYTGDFQVGTYKTKTYVREWKKID